MSNVRRNEVIKRVSPDTVPADPSKWSESSQRSVSAGWVTEYTSFRYSCWRCRASSIFTAADQQYTYEGKKADINQQRALCETCWKRCNAIAAELLRCEASWSTAKSTLRADRAFLENWAKLLEERDEYVAYRADVAKKNMLAKLLRDA
ncbi:zinc-ribbon domain containing protein [Rhizobacter sp. Root1221]|uniref:zinc-ribbon domain containing protein n=1 Tax=Rhizobacter sp. Root1221 TaxID=1736433 RepID=UPI00351403E0